MKDILVIGFHTHEYFISNKRVRKHINKNIKRDNTINFYHIAICYNDHHYLYYNNTIIKHIKSDDINKAYNQLVKLLSERQTYFRLITYWGHGWGPLFGTPKFPKQLLLSAYDFATPLIETKINSHILWLEGCNLGNIITIFDCYKISKYIIGPSNAYGGGSLLSYIHYANFDTDKELIRSFKKIYKKLDPKHNYCSVIYKTKHIPQLIRYFSTIDLASLKWEDRYNKKNIMKEDYNVYNVYRLSDDPKFHKILDKIVAYNENVCSLNIDKFIYAKIYNESLRNTYYKTLNKASKEFYISDPQIVDEC
jgi:hypothetical protein